MLLKGLHHSVLFLLGHGEDGQLKGPDPLHADDGGVVPVQALQAVEVGEQGVHLLVIVVLPFLSEALLARPLIKIPAEEPTALSGLGRAEPHDPDDHLTGLCGGFILFSSAPR